MYLAQGTDLLPPALAPWQVPAPQPAPQPELAPVVFAPQPALQPGISPVVFVPQPAPQPGISPVVFVPQPLPAPPVSFPIAPQPVAAAEIAPVIETYRRDDEGSGGTVYAPQVLDAPQPGTSAPGVTLPPVPFSFDLEEARHVPAANASPGFAPRRVGEPVEARERAGWMVPARAAAAPAPGLPVEAPPGGETPGGSLIPAALAALAAWALFTFSRRLSRVRG